MEDDILKISDSEIDEILNLLKKYSEVDELESSLYVFFDPESGSIKSISSIVDTIEFPYIEIKNKEEKKKFQSQDVFYKFRVAFDPEQKKNILVNIDLDIEQITKIEDLIFQFPIDSEYHDEDIVVIQDVENQQWKFLINENLSQDLNNNPLSFDFYNFYITDYNDPNILHRTVLVPMKELVKDKEVCVDFESSHELENLSVFSRKHFNTHVHVKRHL